MFSFVFEDLNFYRYRVFVSAHEQQNDSKNHLISAHRRGGAIPDPRQ
jgi:hypothetical protein